VIHQLSRHDIYISTRSACSSQRIEESRVLKACRYDHKRSRSGLRVSLSYQNTLEELETFVHVLKKVIRQLDHK